MASWVLQCEKCRKKFFHSEIADSLESLLFVPPKPEFPSKGSEIECPNCHAKALYQRVELTYQA